MGGQLALRLLQTISLAISLTLCPILTHAQTTPTPPPVYDLASSETAPPPLPGSTITAIACDESHVMETLIRLGSGVTSLERHSDCEALGITKETFTMTINYTVGAPYFFSGNATLRLNECQYLNGTRFCLQEKERNLCAVAYAPAQYSVGETAANSTKYGCRLAPKPAAPAPDTGWATRLSPSCTSGHSPDSHYNKSLIGTLNMCVEETLLNAFAGDATGSSTLLRGIQEKAQVGIGAALTLYVILLGLRVLIEQKHIPKSDFIWFFLRFSMVVYFATGPGISTYLPLALDASNGLSNIMLQATSTINSTPGSIFNPSSSNYKGYNYCDFRSAPYAPGKESLQLWDTLDCKFATYMGFDQATGGYFFPKNLGVVILSFFSSPYSVLITLFGSIYIAFIVGYVIRVCCAKMVASCGIAILVFLAPILIPTVLFNFTKSIFNSWLNQLVGIVLQPIILLTFLGIAFNVFDLVYFGNNHYFTSSGTIGMRDASGAITSSRDTDGMRVLCPDQEAPACLLENVFFGSGQAVNMTYIGGQTEGGRLLLVAFAKLGVISFVLFGLITTIEEMSTRLTSSSLGVANIANNSAAGQFAQMLTNPAMITKGVFAGTSALAEKGGGMATRTTGAIFGTGGKLGKSGWDALKNLFNKDKTDTTPPVILPPVNRPSNEQSQALQNAGAPPAPPARLNDAQRQALRGDAPPPYEAPPPPYEEKK